MRVLVPDMWANRGRYRTRPDGSLYPREQRRLRERMALAQRPAPGTEEEEAFDGSEQEEGAWA